MAVILEMEFLMKLTEQQTADLGVPQLVHSFKLGGIAGSSKLVLPSGSAANKQNLVYSDSFSLAATPTTLDLAGTIASKLNGATLTFTNIRGFALRNTSTTTGENITVGGNANGLVNWVTAVGDEIILGPSGLLVIHSPIDGYDVTAGTGDILEFDPGAATITAELAIWGIS